MREIRKMRPPLNAICEIYNVNYNFELEAKVSQSHKKTRGEEGNEHQEVNAIQKSETPPTPCTHSCSWEHQSNNCPTLQNGGQANYVDQYMLD